VLRIPGRTASRPGAADAQDAGQRVWLHLVEHLGNLRDQPPCRDGWPPPLGANAPAFCAAQRPRPPRWHRTPHNIRDDQAQNAEQELLAAEQYAALREAFTSLPPRYQQLITLLIHDPPMPLLPDQRHPSWLICLSQL
jgi:hypothetical protein